jgi:hypothetical protein
MQVPPLLNVTVDPEMEHTVDAEESTVMTTALPELVPDAVTVYAAPPTVAVDGAVDVKLTV